MNKLLGLGGLALGAFIGYEFFKKFDNSCALTEDNHQMLVEMYDKFVAPEELTK